MAREAFNWSLLDRYTLYSILNGARKHIVGRRLLIEDLHKALSNQIKQYLPVKTKLVRDPGQEQGIIYIGGCYYGTDDEYDVDRFIEVVFSYCLFDQHLTVTQYRWRRICTLFADTVLHEIIHMRQYRTRNWKNIPGYYSSAQLAKQRKDQNYYGHPDEIGAFAFNIACELYDQFGSNYQASKRYLDSSQSFRNKRSCYYRYLRTFDMDQNHKVLKRLKKKIIFYLPYAKFGKPFKTTDHLTY
jgi:hypothetical protein